jgi:LysM repeat protein
MCVPSKNVCSKNEEKEATQRASVKRDDLQTCDLSRVAIEQIAANFHRLNKNGLSQAKPGHSGQIKSMLAGAVSVLAIGMLAASPAEANNSVIACGAIHAVEPGDTLFKIARRAYGDGKLYEKIFDANNKLLPNSASLEIGDQLRIPCLDGMGPASRQEALVPETHVEPGALETAQAAVAEELPEPNIETLRRWFETVSTNQARQFALEG